MIKRYIGYVVLALVLFVTGGWCTYKSLVHPSRLSENDRVKRLRVLEALIDKSNAPLTDHCGTPDLKKIKNFLSEMLILSMISEPFSFFALRCNPRNLSSFEDCSLSFGSRKPMTSENSVTYLNFVFDSKTGLLASEPFQCIQVP